MTVALLLEYATGMAVLVLLIGVWFGTQNAWRRVFPTSSAEDDPLADRPSCGSCTRFDACERGAATFDARREDGR